MKLSPGWSPCESHLHKKADYKVPEQYICIDQSRVYQLAIMSRIDNGCECFSLQPLDSHLTCSLLLSSTLHHVSTHMRKYLLPLKPYMELNFIASILSFITRSHPALCCLWYSLHWALVSWDNRVILNHAYSYHKDRAGRHMDSICVLTHTQT